MKSITVKNINREFTGSPLAAEWGEEGIFALSGGGNNFYGQAEKTADGKIRLIFIPPAIRADSEEKFEAKPAGQAPETVKLNNREKDGSVDIFINEQLFTCYNYATPNIVRPYLFPLAGPSGKLMLRTPPLPGNPDKVDHRHHKGIWVSHGDVNGVNNWSEEEGHGYTLHKGFKEVTSGPVFGRIHSVNDWAKEVGTGENKRYKKILEEERIITVYNLPGDFRMIDHETILRATEGEAVFMDTKESGLLSIRLNPSMEERKGGLMVNSNGGRGESECWGQRASWCDYCGEVEGVKCGISIFDRPGNLRYPTWWHIRSYGLFTANFLGTADFTGDKKKSGTYILPAYEEMHLCYRIYVHAGYTAESKVSERYLNFVYPPAVTSE